MGRTKESAKAFAAKLKEIHGDDYFSRMGKLSRGVPKPGCGFASMSPERRKEVSAKGGRNGKGTSKKR